MFDKENTKEINYKITWQKAIKNGVEILCKNKIANFELYNAILETTKKHGAYWVLERGLALAHAPIGNYNKKPGISLVWLKHETQFNNEEKYARILITFSAIDSTSHMKYIKEFSNVFGNENLKKKLLNSTSLKEFLKIYNQKGGENDN